MSVQKYLFAILFVVFLAAMASAATGPVNVVSPSSVNTGQSFDVKFSINNSETKNLTNINLSYVDSKSDPFASVTGASMGARTFTVSLVDSANAVTYNIPLTDIVVPNQTISSEITVTFRVNANALSKTHTEVVSITARDPDGATIAGIASLSVNASVNQVSQISLVKLRDLGVNQSALINVTNAGNTGLSAVTLTAEGSVPVAFSTNNFGLNFRESRTVEITATSASNLRFGSNPLTIRATGSNGASSQIQLDLVKSFCDNGEVGRNLSIQSVEIDTDGDEEDEWKPLDKVVIETEVENVGTDRIGNVYVEFGLFDENGRNVADDLDFDNADEELIKIGSIDDAKEEKATFEFKIPADFKDGSYRVALKAYSKSSGLGEDKLCVSSSSDLSQTFYEDVSVIREDEEGKLITFDDVSMSPTEATCGSRVVVNFDVLNIGEDEEDQVRVSLVNPELAVSASQEIREDLGSGDSESLSLSFNVPDRAISKTYTLRLGAEYDYRNGRYRESTSDPYELQLKVTCANAPGGGSGSSSALITASLAGDSKAEAGEEMTVNARITNTGSNASTFIIGVRNEDSWATLKSVSERVVSLQAGESREVSLVLDVDEDSKGEQSFTIDAISDGRTESRDVVIELAGDDEGKSNFFGSLRNNSLLWIIGLVNLVLIILIIVVAVRLSRR